MVVFVTANDLKTLGLDAEGLKARFDTPTPGELEQRLIKRWRSRVEAGRQWNLTHYRLYHAIDRAWDSDFAQSSNTLVGCVREIADQKDEAAALDVARKWRMTHLIDRGTVLDPKTSRNVNVERLHIPTLYEILISLARNYTLMRVSRIVTERLSVPLFKYEPAMMTELDKLKCEVTTQRVDQMSRDYGYGATLDQAVTYAGMYGHQLQFISEEWHAPKVLHEGVTVVDKEGLRYNLPHPSRSSFDLDHPLWTLNTGTGCRHAQYWQITTFGALLQNKQWWNIERIKHSRNISDPAWELFFQTTGQCRMTLGTDSYQFGGNLDRQNQIEAQYYTRDQEAAPVWTTEHYELINLTEFNPAYPDVDVWFRVVLASDDTPIYMSALPGRPVNAWLWEPTDNRAIQASMMLAAMPFQDHASNLMTQGILSAKQNLANVTLFDEDIVDKTLVRKDLENPNETLYRKLNFWPFKGRQLAKQQGNLDQVFKSYRFPPQSVAEHLQLIGQLLSLLERVLGMSAQEVGSYASHEQSAEEVRAIHTATGQRFEHIASWIDRGVEAWKSQLYTYLMANGTLDAYAYISRDLVPMIQKAGFVVVDEGEKGTKVRAPLGNLRVEAFTSQRDGPNRVPWQQLGQQMIQLVTTFMASPQTMQLIGPEGLVKMINGSFEALGLPREFRLSAAVAQQGMMEEFQAQLQQQLAAFAEQAKKYVDDKQVEMLTQLAQAATPPPAPAA